MENKYAVAILGLVQVLMALAGMIMTIRLIIIGIRRKDPTKYRRAAIVFFSIAGIIVLIAVVEFFLLLDSGGSGSGSA